MDQNMQENGMMENNMEQVLQSMKKEKNIKASGTMVNCQNGSLNEYDYSIFINYWSIYNNSYVMYLMIS